MFTPSALFPEMAVTVPLLILLACGSNKNSENINITLVMLILCFEFALLFYYLAGMRHASNSIQIAFLVMAPLTCVIALLAFVKSYALTRRWRMRGVIGDTLLSSTAFAFAEDKCRDDYGSAHPCDAIPFLAICFVAYLVVYALAASTIIGADVTLVALVVVNTLSKIVCCTLSLEYHWSQFHFRQLFLNGMKEYTKQFLRFLFHEIRVPLNSLTLGTGVLRDASELTDDHAMVLSMMRDAAHAMDESLGDVLALQQLEEGGIQIFKRPFFVRDLLEKAIQDCDDTLRKKNITVLPRVADGVPIKVSGDEFRLKQIVLYLLGNAVNSSPRNGSITVKISSRSRPSTYDKAPSVYELCVEVVDSGPPIPSEALRDMFTAYRYMKARDFTEGRGTGLSLVICRELVTLHGGRILVETDTDKGNVFMFTALCDAIPATPLLVEVHPDINVLHSDADVLSRDAEVTDGMETPPTLATARGSVQQKWPLRPVDSNNWIEVRSSHSAGSAQRESVSSMLSKSRRSLSTRSVHPATAPRAESRSVSVGIGAYTTALVVDGKLVCVFTIPCGLQITLVHPLIHFDSRRCIFKSEDAEYDAEAKRSHSCLCVQRSGGAGDGVS